MLCTEIVSDIQRFFLYTTCSPHVLQKEELLTKIYLYAQLNKHAANETGKENVSKSETKYIS